MIILIFLASFLPVVFVHELGHFIIGILLKAQPHYFSLGVGPSLLNFKIKNINFSLKILPIGGYVAFNTTQFPEIEPSKAKIHPAKWLAIALAGPISNFFFSFLLFSIATFVSLNAFKIYRISSDNSKLNNAVLIENSQLPIKPALFLKHYSKVLVNQNQKIIDSQNQVFELKEFYSQVKLKKIDGLYKIEILYHSFTNGLSILKTYFYETTMAFYNLINGQGKVSGPIGIANQANDSFKDGWLSFILFVASLSFAIGYFNLLPIMLVLDGGRVVAALIELCIKKPITKTSLIYLYKLSWLGILILLTISFAYDLKEVFNLGIIIPK